MLAVPPPGEFRTKKEGAALAVAESTTVAYPARITLVATTSRDAGRPTRSIFRNPRAPLGIST